MVKGVLHTPHPDKAEASLQHRVSASFRSFVPCAAVGEASKLLTFACDTAARALSPSSLEPRSCRRGRVCGALLVLAGGM
eukprot:4832784-Pleurochrysis_carterae.AAC.1